MQSALSHFFPPSWHTQVFSKQTHLAEMSAQIIVPILHETDLDVSLKIIENKEQEFHRSVLSLVEIILMCHGFCVIFND